jgi:YHS domain-containing protein
VRFLGRVLKFFVWFFLITWLGRKLFGWLLAPRRQSPARGPEEPRPATPLFRDPVCGMHVPAELGCSLDQAGQSLHFCSVECRDRYLSTHALAAGA